MKQITRLLTALVFCSLVIFISCKKKKGGGEEDPDNRDIVGAALAGPWVPTSVLFDDANRTEWSEFSIGFSYNPDTDAGNYTVSGVPTDDGASDVWGEGTVNWAFDGDDETADTGTIIREDGVEMSAELDNIESPTKLTLTFSVDDPDARTAGFYGTWKFEFDIQ
ncbi:MAG: hypothetical protein RJQ14_22545 [Marinoscillum sp.]